MEILRSLNDLGIKTKHPIVVTNWTNEEGTRYAPAMLSSGVFAGIHTEDWAKDRVDADGKRFGDELKRIGWEGDEPVGARKMHAFFELHIEQGPTLDSTGGQIGVVAHGLSNPGEASSPSWIERARVTERRLGAAPVGVDQVIQQVPGFGVPVSDVER